MRTASRQATRKPDASGQSLVEFALIFPVLLVMLVAALDLGRAVFAYNSVTNGAREGARLAIVNQDVSRIKTRATSQAALADQSAASVTVTFLDDTASGQPGATLCSPPQIGCHARVQYDTIFEPATPVISNILFPKGVTLTAVSVEPIEFVCPNATTAAAACPKQP